MGTATDTEPVNKTARKPVNKTARASALNTKTEGNGQASSPDADNKGAEVLNGKFLDGMSVTFRPANTKGKTAAPIDPVIAKRLDASLAALEDENKPLGQRYLGFAFVGTAKDYLNMHINGNFAKWTKKANADRVNGRKVRVSSVTHPDSPNKYEPTGENSELEVWRIYTVEFVPEKDTKPATEEAK